MTNIEKSDKKAVVVIPTYNESANIEDLLEAIRKLQTNYQIDILVVDSNSPDGTGERVEGLSRNFPGLSVLHQAQKMGLGCAYRDGFRHLMDKFPNRYDAIITMDADFSHKPSYIPAMLAQLDRFDMVIGSRYVKGGELKDWPRRRQWLSRAGNIYAKVLTGLPLNDLTGGFHCFKSAVLKAVLRHPLVSSGYCHQIEMKLFAVEDGFKVCEIPIVFGDRTKGHSKISRMVVLEAILRVWKMFFRRLLNRRTSDSHPED